MAVIPRHHGLGDGFRAEVDAAVAVEILIAAFPVFDGGVADFDLFEKQLEISVHPAQIQTVFEKQV
jgi:hypothetical protein